MLYAFEGDKVRIFVRLRDEETGGPLDLSSFTSFQFQVKRPDGSSTTWPAFSPSPTEGIIAYDTVATDLNMTGEWLLVPLLISTNYSLAKPAAQLWVLSREAVGQLATVDEVRVLLQSFPGLGATNEALINHAIELRGGETLAELSRVFEVPIRPVMSSFMGHKVVRYPAPIPEIVSMRSAAWVSRIVLAHHTAGQDSALAQMWEQQAALLVRKLFAGELLLAGNKRRGVLPVTSLSKGTDRGVPYIFVIDRSLYIPPVTQETRWQRGLRY